MIDDMVSNIEFIGFDISTAVSLSGDFSHFNIRYSDMFDILSGMVLTGRVMDEFHSVSGIYMPVTTQYNPVSGKIRDNYYIDPAELVVELKNYRRTGEISEKLGNMFLTLARKYVMLPRYYLYSYREDFVSHAVERMVSQIDKINIDHPRSNPFFYLSTLCDNACKAFIILEKNFTRTKDVLKDRLFETFEHEEHIRMKDNPENEKHGKDMPDEH